MSRVCFWSTSRRAANAAGKSLAISCADVSSSFSSIFAMMIVCLLISGLSFVALLALVLSPHADLRAQSPHSSIMGMATAKQKKEREDLWLRVAQGVVVVFVLGALIWFFTIGSQISTLSGKIGQLEALVGTKLDGMTTALDRSTGIIDKATAPKPNEPPPVDRCELKQLESGVTSQVGQLTTRIAQLETLLAARVDEVNRAVERSESNLAKCSSGLWPIRGSKRCRMR